MLERSEKENCTNANNVRRAGSLTKGRNTSRVQLKLSGI